VRSDAAELRSRSARPIPVDADTFDTGSVPSKRAIAKADAAELIDIEARLAPFFPPQDTTSPGRADRAPEFSDSL